MSVYYPCRADIGTSSGQWDDGKNPTNEEDVCKGNTIRNNYIATNVSLGEGYHLSSNIGFRWSYSHVLPPSVCIGTFSQCGQEGISLPLPLVRNTTVSKAKSTAIFTSYPVRS